MISYICIFISEPTGTRIVIAPLSGLYGTGKAITPLISSANAAVEARQPARISAPRIFALFLIRDPAIRLDRFSVNGVPAFLRKPNEERPVKKLFSGTVGEGKILTVFNIVERQMCLPDDAVHDLCEFAAFGDEVPPYVRVQEELDVAGRTLDR